MPDVPHQIGARRIAAACMVLVLAALAGCAADGGAARRAWTPVSLPSADVTPRVIVFGDVQRFLPRYRDESALERFLYGPRDAGEPRLRNPQGLAFVTGGLLVCDQGFEAVTRVDLMTGRIGGWHARSRPPRCPVDLCVADDGRVYVADTTLLGVLVYESDGTFVESLHPGPEPSMAFRPSSVAVRDGVLYVGNIGGREIARFDLGRRAWLPVWRSRGRNELIAPTGLCANGADALLVADAISGVVHRIRYDGQWGEPIGRPGRGPGQFVRPKQVVRTPGGLVFVTDAGRQSILVFAASGEFLFELSGDGGRWEGFTLPAALAVASDGIPALLAERCAEPEATDVDEWLVASDTLGRVSVTVLGVVLD
jgi:hypothetical protein